MFLGGEICTISTRKEETRMEAKSNGFIDENWKMKGNGKHVHFEVR